MCRGQNKEAPLILSGNARSAGRRSCEPSRCWCFLTTQPRLKYVMGILLADNSSWNPAISKHDRDRSNMGGLLLFSCFFCKTCTNSSHCTASSGYFFGQLRHPLLGDTAMNTTPHKNPRQPPAASSAGQPGVELDFRPAGFFARCLQLPPVMPIRERPGSAKPQNHLKQMELRTFTGLFAHQWLGAGPFPREFVLQKEMTKAPSTSRSS